MRVVVVTRIPPVFLGFVAALEANGHEPVALLTNSDGPFLSELLAVVPKGMDVVMPGTRKAVARLLRPFEPDLVLCMGFPWKIPPDALAVPQLGWLNGHPSALPRHRGPVPVAWAIRNGDAELGISFHFMDAELDTGPLVAQRTMPIGDEFAVPDEFFARMGPVVVETLTEALVKIAAGDLGTSQPDGGEYETFFGEEDVWLDLSRPAAEVHRLVWAWLFTIPVGTPQGPFLEVDGATVRVLESSLAEVDGAVRVECGDGPLWLVRTEPVETPARP